MKRASNFLVAITGIFTVVLGTTANAEVVLSDDFNSYADTAALQAAWPNALTTPGSLPVLGTSATAPFQITGAQETKLNTLTPMTSNFMSLGNGVVSHDLGVNLSTDWTVDISILGSTYARSFYFLMLDANTNSGYGVWWNGANVNQNSANGSVSIRKLTNLNFSTFATITATTAGGVQETATILGAFTNPRADMSTTGMFTGYPVTATSGSDVNAATYNADGWMGYVDWSLTWVAATGQLTLFANGNQRIQVTDNTFTNFNRIYLKGGTNGLFDDLVVSSTVIPEPSALTLAALAGGTGALLAWRRRRINLGK